MDRELVRELRELAPRVLGVLARRAQDFGAAEDAVQEALIAAAAEWPKQGKPENPRAWLIRVGSRKLVDHVRAETARRKREALVVSLVPPEEQIALGIALEESASLAEDDTLALLFICCSDVLSPASAIALTLRAVGGLGTAEIARAFLVPEATLAQRISRAKQRIFEAKIPFELPPAEARAARLSAVMHVLYLMFNEGYTASSGAELERVDLAAEALRLTRLLLRIVPDNPEIEGLLALMLLTDARRAARTDELGALIPLDEQNRALWDRAAIAEGSRLVSQALQRGAAGAYQVQAAIAALHDEASSTDTTDWRQILELYGLLLRMSPSPMVMLNRAVALAMVHGPEAALVELEPLSRDSRLAEHHRLHAVRGHLLERAGKLAAAIDAYTTAAKLTASIPERDYLVKRAARARAGRRDVSEKKPGQS